MSDSTNVDHNEDDFQAERYSSVESDGMSGISSDSSSVADTSIVDTIETDSLLFSGSTDDDDDSSFSGLLECDIQNSRLEAENRHMSNAKGRVSVLCLNCPGCIFENERESVIPALKEVENMVNEHTIHRSRSLDSKLQDVEPVLDWRTDLLEMSSIEGDINFSDNFQSEDEQENVNILPNGNDNKSASSVSSQEQSVSRLEAFIDSCLSGDAFEGFCPDPAIKTRLSKLGDIRKTILEKNANTLDMEVCGSVEGYPDPLTRHTRSKGPVPSLPNVQSRLLERKQFSRFRNIVTSSPSTDP
jgi:hypothetical protein